MQISFLSEMGFTGKIPANHPNMRTEFAWFFALNADHYNIGDFPKVSGYDWVFLILPKGGVSLNSEGIALNDQPNRFSQLYTLPFVEHLKSQNKKVAFVQEGPSWYVNDFSILDQFNFYNQLAECDVIFAHNSNDMKWYSGWFPGKKVTTMPTLMIEELIQSISPITENKAIIGGGFCRWYGGFQSYLCATEFEVPIYVQTSHASQPGEDQVPNLNILPRLVWVEWIKALSSFKYAVHLMPTAAAGTFNLNCAYFGIPCIGNIEVDTQKLCHPSLSVQVYDINTARQLAQLLKEDPVFYKKCSEEAKNNYRKYYSLDKWKEKVYSIIYE
jgi:hypothetical protein